MKITLRGLRRDMGPTVITDDDIPNLENRYDTELRVYQDQRPTIFMQPGEIALAWHQKLRHMGDYRMEVRLSKSDIFHLFKLTCGYQLTPSLLKELGVTVSPDLKKAILKNIKLSDLTLGELAAM